MLKILDRLEKIGVELPDAAVPVANYASFVNYSGGKIYVSGQLPLENGDLKYGGKVGTDVSVEDAQKAARLCAINILSQLKLACEGQLGRVSRCIRLGVFVNAGPDFTDHPSVANGASDFIVAALGAEAGKHARAAVGCSSLPRGACVEVEAIFQID